MCGRFTLFEPDRIISREFGATIAGPIVPRYNIAPSQAVAAVRPSPGGTGRELAMLRWGLVPRWAKDRSIGDRLINARAETVSAKPAFRGAFRDRRCLLPASGFYEWRKMERGKRPYFIRMRGGRLFAFAGLWERWEDPGGEVVESCAILTTDADEAVKPIHDRMPVIVAPADYALWLDPTVRTPEPLMRLLRPCDPGELEIYPVRTIVNDPSREGPECIKEAS